jgi:predicted peroxiredoxin
MSDLEKFIENAKDLEGINVYVDETLLSMRNMRQLQIANDAMQKLVDQDQGDKDDTV